MGVEGVERNAERALEKGLSPLDLPSLGSRLIVQKSVRHPRIPLTCHAQIIADRVGVMDLMHHRFSEPVQCSAHLSGDVWLGLDLAGLYRAQR